MKPNYEGFGSAYEILCWVMAKNSGGNPYVLQELIILRNRERINNIEKNRPYKER